MSGAVALQPVEFNVCGPLPSGVTVLEASAGTGKTYTIAALAARYVAEGIPLERLLLVTFTRIATGELRERVRERLVEVERGLTRRLAGGGACPDEDPVVALLADGDGAGARHRLAQAIAGFDAATIATTHGFCQEVLGGLGVAGDLEPDVAFVEDLSDLVADVVDDLYVRRFSRGEAPPFKRAEAAAIARAAIENPMAQIVSGDSPVAQMRRRLAQRARHELDGRKRAMAVMTYDDLVSRLQAALSGPGREATAAQLRERFEVVLVDEFQDTDPAQWEIMQRAFGTGTTLVLIADPKQAIYAFRGADVYAYLEAAVTADARRTLQINWRSDQALIDAHDALFSGVKLGHEGIAYRHVRAAERHQHPGMTGAPVGAALRVRVVLRDDPTVLLTRSGYAASAGARRHIACDLAADAVALLDSSARVTAAPDGVGTEPVRPAHVAVLVRTNRQAAMIRDALGDAGVPAVINGAGSVFGTDSAREWLRLLEVLERPASITRAHSAALTCFVGWSAEQLAAADDDSWAWEEVHRRLHEWARILRTRGVASLLETVMRYRPASAPAPSGSDATALRSALPGRVLVEQTGERRLTDLRHIGQLLQGAATGEQMGATALSGWLRTRIAAADRDTGDEERSRRLESDAEAVQVLTIHRSKGLEFPIVYLPFLWEPGYIPQDRQPVFFHDPTAGDARTLDVALEGRDYAAHRDLFIAEQRGEDLRLAYVALTRARHQAVVWWAGSYASRDSPLGRLLFSRTIAGDVAPSGSSTPGDATVLARLNTLAHDAGGPDRISVERSVLGARSAWSPPLPEAAELEASLFQRPLDRRWRRTSYSDITAANHDAWVTSEPEQPLLADEPPGPAAGLVAEAAPPPTAARSDSAAPPSLLAEMATGVEVGTFVHRVMEATDFAAADLDAELTARIAACGAGPLEPGPPETLATGLRAVIETPLGPVVDDAPLRRFGRSDRLDELGFELPLAGGDRPSGWLTLARIGDVLRRHAAVDDPLRTYADRLGDPQLRQSVRGYLTGSLDLVLRLPGRDGPRFAVVDYKTNWLGGPDQPLSIWHYRPEALTAEMLRHHYALQALLYAVALHRFLRWRLPAYEPSRHLAGVVYLFVRAMSGVGTPTAGGSPYGVFGWRPAPGLVPALSDALGAGEGGG